MGRHKKSPFEGVETPDELAQALTSQRLRLVDLKAAQMIRELKGWLPAAGAPGAPETPATPTKVEQKLPARKRYSVGDLFTYDGRQFRVTAVSAEGIPTKGDPIEEEA
jgi:hypothetical protein